ncbi:MAG TPA: hypothetical protein PLU35_05645 [Phycisphaerales bacterium]|nr:hypothetical protein [Phycisphaerales bacterium]
MMPGERIKIVKWIEGIAQGLPFAVRIELDAVIPAEDTSEPCLEPPTVRLLDRLRDLAAAGDLDALSKHGRVYVRKSA